MSFTSFADGTRWSDIHAAAACAFLAGTAMFTADFALILELQSTGLGGAAVATLIICGTLPMVLLAPITGRMADRFDSRTLMAASGTRIESVADVLGHTGITLARSVYIHTTAPTVIHAVAPMTEALTGTEEAPQEGGEAAEA